MRHKTQISAIVVAMVIIVGLKLAYDRSGRNDSDTPTVSSKAPGPLGVVIDAAIGTDGRTYLADTGRQTVRVLDNHFRALGEVGAPDSATGRYRDLQAVRAVGDGRFAALDRTLRRIDVYEWDDGVIVLTSRTVPIFEVYRGASIASMVRTRIDSIWPVSRIDIETRVLDNGRSSVSFAAGAAGYHSPMRAVAVPGGFLVTAPLATVPVRDRNASEQPDSVRVFEFALTTAGVQRRSSVAGEAVPVAPGTFLAARPEQAGAGQLRMLRYSEMSGQGRASTADSLQPGVVPGKR